ncbi:hypothetical protein [Streptomyces nojiriensis]|uniref:hypothetical protein n=1 Tax=Streptomyces nojiriensis TaxID=66374 RepID=UPI003646B79D
MAATGHLEQMRSWFGRHHLDGDHGAAGRHQDQVRPVHRLGTGRGPRGSPRAGPLGHPGYAQVREELRRPPGHRLGGADLALGEHRAPGRLQGEADVGEGQAQPLARAGRRR